MRIVISQPMFLPWSGLFEQLQLADVFVHYDDVQRPQGRSFMTRVQIKVDFGQTWLSAQIDKNRSGQNICDTFLVSDAHWRSKHLKRLANVYAKAAHCDAMMELATRIYDFSGDNLSEFNRHGIEVIADWLGLQARFVLSSELGILGKSSDRLVDICHKLGATEYITGQGALQYLDCSRFDASNIRVSLMDYSNTEYPQLFGDFTPFVTILDAIANCGEGAREILRPKTIPFEAKKNGSSRNF